MPKKLEEMEINILGHEIVLAVCNNRNIRRNKEEVLWCGNLNAKIGVQKSSLIIGRYEKETINDNGHRLMWSFLNENPQWTLQTPRNTLIYKEPTNEAIRISYRLFRCKTNIKS